MRSRQCLVVALLGLVTPEVDRVCRGIRQLLQLHGPPWKDVAVQLVDEALDERRPGDLLPKQSSAVEVKDLLGTHCGSTYSNDVAERPKRTKASGHSVPAFYLGLPRRHRHNVRV